MTKAPPPTRPSPGQPPRQQSSLPFHETPPSTPRFAEAPRAAAVALLRQMLIDAVLAEGRTTAINNDKETDHE